MAKLLLEGTNKHYSLEELPLVIGRSSQSSVTIDDNNSSRKHCEVDKSGSEFYVKDLDSFNGTFVNGNRITKHTLKADDKIRIGGTVFIFQAGDSTQPTTEKMRSEVYLLVGKQKKKIIVPMGTSTVGRKKGNDICIPDEQVSSKHAEIIWDWNKKEAFLKDLNSKNGTFVNRRQLKNSTIAIKPGDVLVFGRVACTFVDPEHTEKAVPALVQKTISSNSKPLLATLAIVICMTLGLVAVIYFSIGPGNQTPVIVGNLIDDYSFEDEIGWAFTGKAAINRDASAKTGKRFLHFPLSKGFSQREARYWANIPLGFAKAYEISAWIRSKNLHGTAGIKLSWLCNGKPNYTLHSFIPLATNSSFNWQQLKHTIIPPADAKNLKISCVVAGEGAVDMDDILVLEKESSSKFARNSLRKGELQVFIDKCGVLEIYRNTHLILATGKLNVWKNIGNSPKLIADQSFAYGTTQVQGNKLVWDGKLYHRDKKSVFEATIICQNSQDGLSIEVNIKGEQKPKKGYIDYSFGVYPNQLQGNIYLGTEQKTQTITAEKLTAWTITHMVWETEKDSNEKQLGFIYEQPTLCTLNMNSQLPVLHQEVTWLGTNCRFKLKLKEDFLADFQILKSLKKELQKLSQQNRPGATYQIYQKIKNNLLFYREKVSPQAKLYELNQKYQKEVTDILQILEQARFFRTLEYYQACVIKCEEATRKWQGMPIKRLEEISQTVKLEQKELRSGFAEKEIKHLLTQAKALEAEKSFALALLFYREIISRFPEKKQYQEKITLLEKQIKKLEKK